MDDEQELNYPSDNTDSYHVEEDDMDSKRFDADAFLPSRGKKWSSSSRTDYGDSQRKRYNLPGGFIATRGKKDQDSWLNARGRRLSAGQFHGVRGKRTWASEEIEDSAALGDQLQMLINYLRELKSDRYAGLLLVFVTFTRCTTVYGICQQQTKGNVQWIEVVFRGSETQLQSTENWSRTLYTIILYENSILTEMQVCYWCFWPSSVHVLLPYGISQH